MGEGGECRNVVLLGVLFPRKSGSMGRHQTLTSKSSTGRSTVDVNPGLSKGSSMESADSTRTNPFPLGDILQRCAPSDLSSSDNWQFGLERLNNENMDSN